MVLSGAVLVEEPVGGLNIVDHTVSDGTQISGGNLMILSDLRTATSSSASDPGASGIDSVMSAGVATSEKKADDGQINLGCAQDGIYDIKTTSACIVGSAMMISGANTVAPVPIGLENISGGAIFGYAKEAGAANEVIEVEVGR